MKEERKEEGEKSVLKPYFIKLLAALKAPGKGRKQ